MLTPATKERNQTDAWHQYALDAVAGRLPANKLVRLACQRYLDDLEEADTRGLYFDWAAARRVVIFFATFLRHSKGEWGGQPFLLGPWQQFIVANLFGWKRKIDGTRRFRMAYIAIPRKNGKSTLAAGIGLYLLVADGEPGAEIYAFATKKDQAKIIFDEATRMWEASPDLQRRVGHFRNNLHVRSTNSKFEPLSSDGDTMDGLNASAALGDELHEQPSREVWDKLATSMGARRQGLMLGITTAGEDRQTFCFDQDRLARQILEGAVVNDGVFAFIACLDVDDAHDWKALWEQPEEWAKANPNYGVSVKTDFLESAALEAKQQPTKLNAFLRYHLNVWTQGSTRAISPDKWRLCAGVDTNDPADAVRERWKAELLGRACYGGLDLADTTDIAAFLAYFPRTEDNPQPRVLPFFFVPEEALIERSKKDRVPYDMWERQGFLFKTPGNVIDYGFIRKFLQAFNDDYRVIEIGYDRWNSTQLVSQLQEEDHIEMVQVGQGFLGMSAATKEMLKMVVGVEFAHGGNPVLTWMADNLIVTQDPAGNLKPDRAKAREKIDGMVAFAMAIGRAMAQPQVPAGGAPAVWRV